MVVLEIIVIRSGNERKDIGDIGMREFRACPFAIPKYDAPYRRWCKILKADCNTRIVKCPFIRALYYGEIKLEEKHLPAVYIDVTKPITVEVVKPIRVAIRPPIPSR